MQTEKQRERLVELIKKYRREWLEKEYDHETEKSVDEYVADYLIANGVTVKIKQEEMTKILLSLFQFAKSIQSEKVELQKDEYLYLLEYMEKAENAIMERKENEK
jgi:hypothetical protein